MTVKGNGVRTYEQDTLLPHQPAGGSVLIYGKRIRAYEFPMVGKLDA